MEKYLFVGGDKRQEYAAGYIERAGCDVNFAYTYTQLKSMIGMADCIVLPLPVSRDKVHINSDPKTGLITVEEFVFLLEKGMTVMAGMPDAELSDRIKGKGVELYDYYKNETLTVLNSISTAEGVLYELIGNSDVNLNRSKILVTGYGKAASAIAKRLVALGSEVVVAARSERDRIAAYSDMCKAISLYEVESVADRFDFVINTVPAVILGENVISKLKKDCLMVEIASYPFGIDFKSAEKHGIKVIKAPSLPGRISPKSAGEAIAKTLLSIRKGTVTDLG